MEVGENDEVGKYVKKQTRSVSEGWGKKIVGRRVDFKDSEKGLAWGIEVELPFGDKERKTLEKAGIIIPKRINKIRYLDMAPQENLPEKERNIGSESNQELVLSHLNTLVGVTATPGYPGPTLLFRNRVEKRLRHLFEGVITRKKRNKELFNSKIAESKGNEILMVYGHGGGDPMLIGEQDDDKTQTQYFFLFLEGFLVVPYLNILFYLFSLE